MDRIVRLGPSGTDGESCQDGLKRTPCGRSHPSSAVDPEGGVRLAGPNDERLDGFDHVVGEVGAVHSRSHPAADSLGVEGRVCRTYEIRAAFAAQAALHAVHHVADSQVAISVNHDDGAPPSTPGAYSSIG